MTAQGAHDAGAPRYEHFPHDADIGVRGFGRSPAEAFEQAALAMTAVATRVADIAPERTVDITCEAPDLELLLADWLNAIVYEMGARNMVFGRFEVLINVRIDSVRLEGKAFGETLDASKHEQGVEVKGATYTSLEVAERADGTWVAQCVIDV
ncbi:MAG TPA: archease [Gammaproteobacteria bacterium]|nr:archease [Gammaproteobacteria bacterium]